MCPRIGASRCFPLPSSGYRGRPSQGPAVPHLRGYYGVVRPLRHPSTVTSGLPWWPVPPLRRWEALLGSWRIPVEACPELETPAAPVRPHPTGRPGTAFRSHNSVGVRHDSISELNLRGLLPCCVRFAPTGHPVNGNTGYRPAGSLWPGGTRTRWIPLRGFTGSFQLLLFQAFPNAICG
jgi:hypothetical protein